MEGSTYKNIKFIIYIICFVNIMVAKWTFMYDEAYLVEVLYSRIYVLPCILLSALFYFYFRYYKNTFVITRFRAEKKYILSHCMDVLKESCMLALFQIILILLLDLKIFSEYSLLQILSIVSVIVLIYCVIGMIYLVVFFLTEKFYLCFIADGLFIIAHYLYVVYWLMYGGFSAGALASAERLKLSLLCLLIIGICLLIISRKIFSIFKDFHKLLVFIGYFFVEYISVNFLRAYTVDYSLFSFDSLELFDSSELFIVFLFYVIPIIFVLFINFRRIIHSYHYNLLFYMVRISNRFIWVRKQYLDIFKDVFIFAVIKTIVIIMIYKTFSVELLISAVIYVIYMYFLSSVLMCSYFISKDTSILNYYIIIYVIVFLMSVISGNNVMSFISLDYHINSILIDIFILVLTFIINVYIINHDEYYG